MYGSRAYRPRTLSTSARAVISRVNGQRVGYRFAVTAVERSTRGDEEFVPLAKLKLSYANWQSSHPQTVVPVGSTPTESTNADGSGSRP